MDSPFYFEAVDEDGSDGDERAPYEWLSRGGCLGDAKGRGTRVLPDVDPAAVTTDDIRELKAIYRRYGGDETQPASLEESANASN